VAVVGTGVAAVAASPEIVAVGLAGVAITPAGYLIYDGLSQGDYFNEQPLAPGQTAPYQPPQHQGIPDQACGVACPVSITEPFGTDQTATLAQTPIGYKPFAPGNATLHHPGTTSNLVPNTLAARGTRPTGGIGDPNSCGGIYQLIDPITGQVMRTGRATNFVKRRSDHANAPATKGLVFQPVYRTDNPNEQRGLEGYVYDLYPNAPLNNEVPVSNKPSKAAKKAIYQAACTAFLKGNGVSVP